MDKEGIAFRKMALALEATKAVQAEDNVLEEIKTAAFEALLLNPGIGYSEWKRIMLEQYTMEVYDAFGEDEEDVAHYGSVLAKLWQEEYTDIASGLTYDYYGWSKAFATKQSVQMYYDMIGKLKNVGAK